MRENGLQNWQGGRVFVVIDEYSEIQNDIDAAEREDNATAKRLAGNLARIARRARSLGIVLICALQKSPLDSISSAVKDNLNCRICMRVSNQLGASVLDGLDESPVYPADLRRGRFVYYDASRAGEQLYMQAQIAPGVQLDG